MIRRLQADDHVAYSAVRLRGLELHPEAFGTGAPDWKAGTPEQVYDWASEVSQRPIAVLLSGSMDVADPVGRATRFYRRALG